ncbi:MAG TPA: hypothetical protein VH208_01035 [Myxococcaceae bacterium]|nr:hypothetical protein [Myxococcaceae bacterium]
MNTAAWDGPTAPDVRPEWLVVNAPRPLPGRITWQGDFLCGIFYAAGPPDDFDQLGDSWRRLDARRVELIDNPEIERRVRSYLSAQGYGTPEELEMSIAELAAVMEEPLPWREA